MKPPSNFFRDKKVLIIGGTGTVGRGLLHSILADGAAVVRVFSRDESKQFELGHELGSRPDVRFLLGDVRDRERLMRAMEGIDTVFHCAALKHVPACEYNPFEAVKTNVLGTQNVIDAALASGVKRVVATSTDKSISPTNTMGATKLLAERLVAAADHYKGNKDIVLTSVRFGNVMGSRGSVIPLFEKQIATQRRITVTDRDMVRFMMSINQAVALTKKAAMMAKGGEIFVLKMPVVRLGDLAEVVVEETAARLGMSPSDVAWETMGLRPGEKRYEELMTAEEAEHALETDDMYIVPSVFGGRRHFYAAARPAPRQSYSAASEPPFSKEQVRWLLKEQNFGTSEIVGGMVDESAGDRWSRVHRAVAR